MRIPPLLQTIFKKNYEKLKLATLKHLIATGYTIPVMNNTPKQKLHKMGYIKKILALASKQWIKQ